MYQQPLQQCQEAAQSDWQLIPEACARAAVKRRADAHMGPFPADGSHAQLWLLGTKQTNSPIVKEPFEFPLKGVPSLGEATASYPILLEELRRTQNPNEKMKLYQPQSRDTPE